ncbi:MAG TPA: hypothetical protein PKD17_12010 [Cellvibrionaceae bacterium]|nr:hypothetical protein [Cellvibrionaceae bacterium]HMW72542.1 hypothetical protein [Cellvibrionaceae bacterium]HNG59857.1 hypothetical protein [Cellvibrionaceae bacterium]
MLSFKTPITYLKRTVCALFAGACLSLSAQADSGEIIASLIPTIKKWGENPILVAAVKEQNAKKLSLEAIQKRDKEWMATTGLDDQMKALMKNAAANELNQLEATKPYFFESILMDNQGANVAMTNKTSDYWQGDEDKFTNAYKSGAGGVDIGKSKFDDSAKAYLVQISVPVVDGSSVIGALCVGINLDELEKAK